VPKITRKVLRENVESNGVHYATLHDELDEAAAAATAATAAAAAGWIHLHPERGYLEQHLPAAAATSAAATSATAIATATATARSSQDKNAQTH